MADVLPPRVNQPALQLEDDPHHAAFEDNPPTQPKVGAKAWMAIFVC